MARVIVVKVWGERPYCERLGHPAQVIARTRNNVVYAQSGFWEFHFGYLGCPVLDMYRMDFGRLFFELLRSLASVRVSMSLRGSFGCRSHVSSAWECA